MSSVTLTLSRGVRHLSLSTNSPPNPNPNPNPLTPNQKRPPFSEFILKTALVFSSVIINLFMSQRSITHDFSQEIGETPINMAYKRQRRGTRQFGKKNNARAIVRVPRAISTRGTPDGYYEIPVRQLFRIYGNTTTGLWNTNQTTNAPIGVTGYTGMAIYASLDNTYISLGNGSSSATITQGTPDYSASVSMFDLCKIVDMKFEVWFTNHSRELSSGTDTYGAPELFIAEDVNDSVPPSVITDVLSKKRVVRCSAMSDRKFSMTIRPHLVLDTSAHDGSGSATTTSMAQAATYCRLDRPAAVHYGLKGFASIPSASAVAYQYCVNILVTQTRRFKMNN